MAKVFTFAPRAGRFNMKSAEVFGDIHFCEPEAPIFCTEELTDELSAALEGFDPREDYIAATGNHVVVGLTLALAISDYGEIRILIFDATSSQYVARKVGWN